MAAALQLLKSISRRRQERHDLEMQMLVKQKSESRKRKLQMMEDDEIDTAKAMRPSLRRPVFIPDDFNV